MSQLQIGTIVTTSYDTGPYRIISVRRGCRCPSYLDMMNKPLSPPRRRPHVHLIVVPAAIPPGKEQERDWRWLNGYEELPDGRILNLEQHGPGAAISHDEVFIQGGAAGVQLEMF